MNNYEKLVGAFTSSLGISEDLVNDNLEYNGISEWYSIAHMTLIAELESIFDIMLDTDQIIDMSSVAKAKEILLTHDVNF